MDGLLSSHMTLAMHFMADLSAHKSDAFPKMDSAETIEKVCLSCGQTNTTKNRIVILQGLFIHY
jgi:hypothetical protein